MYSNSARGVVGCGPHQLPHDKHTNLSTHTVKMIKIIRALHYTDAYLIHIVVFLSTHWSKFLVYLLSPVAVTSRDTLYEYIFAYPPLRIVVSSSHQINAARISQKHYNSNLSLTILCRVPLPLYLTGCGEDRSYPLTAWCTLTQTN